MNQASLPRPEAIRLAVIGLGYVGLPLAVGFGRKLPTLGFDVNTARIDELKQQRDHTLEVSSEELRSATQLGFSCDIEDLKGCNVFIVSVPTPVGRGKRPDLTPLKSASTTVGRAIGRGGVAIFESTVYPGATEEVCVPIIEEESGLKFNQDFYAGYSPERINPGDKEHRLDTIKKVTSGSTPEVADFVDDLYRRVVSAGTHKASSIKVAEAAKVIENTQRDLNIALMNEVAKICHLLGIRTRDVLDAAGTKWNFLKFHPGLVGGHCIGVDPYYLTAKAEQLGYQPEVILSGRRVNDGMGAYLAQRVVKLIAGNGQPMDKARVGILGFTFKENVPDIRNSKVIDTFRELREFGIEPIVHDPLADADAVREEYGVELAPIEDLKDLRALIYAVGHDEYRPLHGRISDLVAEGGIVADVRSLLDPASLRPDIRYWSL